MLTFIRPEPAEAQTSDTVGSFAQELRKTPETLIAQLREAGVAKASADEPLSAQEKQRLLHHLQAVHGAAVQRKRITVVKAAAGNRRHHPQTGRTVLVGGLGGFDYGKAGDRGQGLLDAYERFLRDFYVRLTDCTTIERGPDHPYREVCRRLTRTLQRLRRSVTRTPVCHRSTRVRLPRGVKRLGGAFFHLLKVDGRNLP